jgi:hypothetical protein
MPDAGFPLVNDLPTNNVSQSAPIDGVVPINACSIVVAVAGSASNQCEPTHLATTPTGSVPVNVPVTVCSVTAAIDGNASGVCTGASTGTTLPIGTPGSPGTGITLPITICGIQLAIGGTSSASCPTPAVTTAASTPPAASPTTVPVKLAAATPTPVKTAAASTGPLALTGAPLVVELFIGGAALLLGLVITRLSRRREAQKA